jgi:hypothetical protein
VLIKPYTEADVAQALALLLAPQHGTAPGRH